MVDSTVSLDKISSLYRRVSGTQLKRVIRFCSSNFCDIIMNMEIILRKLENILFSVAIKLYSILCKEHKYCIPVWVSESGGREGALEWWVEDEGDYLVDSGNNKVKTEKKGKKEKIFTERERECVY